VASAKPSNPGRASNWVPYPIHKALPGFFLCIFSSLACLKKPVFKQAGSSAVEGTSEAVLRSSDQRKVPASPPSLFLKSEKIPALLYVGKGPAYRPFRDFRSVPSNHRRACTQALLLYVKTFSNLRDLTTYSN
jgi:hypothetical protein